MFTSHIDTFKVEATNAILARLGKDAYETLRQDLQTRYKIELTKHTSYTLQELSDALGELLGEGSARLLMRTIHAEIDVLAKYDTR